VIPGLEELELPRLRQGLYRFFAAALLPPETARVDQLEPAAGLLEDLGVDTLAFAEPWLAMRRSLAERPTIEALQAQYVHLFESGSDGALSPPVESFYVSTPRQGVEYRRLGFEVGTDHQLDVDHICPQLELMALLCAREATAGECGDLTSVAEWNAEQRQFTDTHLSRWMPPFAARVRSAASPGPYCDIVVTLEAFVDHDRELLHVLERTQHQ
jgi:TorA maturation chaperone TorD